jgi:hypothetical protein
MATAVAGSATAADPGAVKPSAMIKQIDGRVFVRTDQTTKLARIDMPVYSGNRVVSVAKAKVGLAYPDGCTLTLPENSLLVIGAPDQCSAGLAKVQSTAGFQDKAIGQIAESAIGANWYAATQAAIANALVNTGVLGAGVTATSAAALSAAATVMAVAGVGLVVVAGTVTVVGITEASARSDNSAEVQSYLNALASSREITVTPPASEPTPPPSISRS